MCVLVAILNGPWCVPWILNMQVSLSGGGRAMEWAFVHLNICPLLAACDDVGWALGLAEPWPRDQRRKLSPAWLTRADCPAPGLAWAELYGYEPWDPTRGVVMSPSESDILLVFYRNCFDCICCCEVAICVLMTRKHAEVNCIDCGSDRI